MCSGNLKRVGVKQSTQESSKVNLEGSVVALCAKILSAYLRFVALNMK